MKNRIEMLEEKTNVAKEKEMDDDEKKKQVLFKQGFLIGSILGSANTSLTSLFNEVTDWLLFYRAYWISMKP
jgi:hypothetical protein